jgi:XTP/dITP diphosphohydrolase
MRLLIVSNNIHKVEEIRHAINQDLELLTLKEIGFYDEIPELENTISGNAIQKARFVYDRLHINCIADDTGLEIEALGGEPGVYSARYSGINRTFKDNIRKVLRKMERIDNRRARFYTVIALIWEGKLETFEGSINGTILKNERGNFGFGYDSIFQPDGMNKSFAEISLDEKNKISHRAIAIQKLKEYLQKL